MPQQWRTSWGSLWNSGHESFHPQPQGRPSSIRVEIGHPAGPTVLTLVMKQRARTPHGERKEAKHGLALLVSLMGWVMIMGALGCRHVTGDQIMTNPEIMQDRNREAVDRLNAEVQRDPAHPYHGKFIGIIDGQVAVVADTGSELLDRLEQMGADPQNCLCFEAGLDYEEVQEIWSLSCPAPSGRSPTAGRSSKSN